MANRREQRDPVTGKSNRIQASGRDRSITSSSSCCCENCYCSTDRSTSLHSTLAITITGGTSPTHCIDVAYFDGFEGCSGGCDPTGGSCGIYFNSFPIYGTFCVPQLAYCGGCVEIPIDVEQFCGPGCGCNNYLTATECCHTKFTSFSLCLNTIWVAGKGAMVVVSGSIGFSDTPCPGRYASGLQLSPWMILLGTQPAQTPPGYLPCGGSVTFTPDLYGIDFVWYDEDFVSIDNLGIAHGTTSTPHPWIASVTVSDTAC